MNIRTKSFVLDEKMAALLKAVAKKDLIERLRGIRPETLLAYNNSFYEFETFFLRESSTESYLNEMDVEYIVVPITHNEYEYYILYREVLLN